MAFKICLFRCVFHRIKPVLAIQNYSTRAPLALGGTLRRRRKGQSHDVAKSLAEKIAIRNVADPDFEPVNIGDHYVGVKISRKQRLEHWKANRENPELEQAARHNTVVIPLDEVKKEWRTELGPKHTQVLAEHYGVYRDLFNDAHFIPHVMLNIFYDYDEEFVTPVYRGNKISPSEVQTVPQVEYEAEADSLYTLVLTNPDGHLTDNEAEYLHWFVGNIPGDDVSQGQVLCDYLRPFPPKGTGFHRHIFVLYKQDKKIDYSKEQRPPNCNSLQERTFTTLEFFREHQDHLTPVGLSFFQSEWDHSVREVYHDILDMKEPEFEFVHPPPYHPPMVRYPRKEPFDRYYERYMDKKDLREEVLKLKLSMISPFKETPPPPKYPLIHRYAGYKPTWLKRKEEVMHRRLEQYRDLP